MVAGGVGWGYGSGKEVGVVMKRQQEGSLWRYRRRILNASVSISCFDTKLVLQDISYYWGETE